MNRINELITETVMEERFTSLYSKIKNIEIYESFKVLNQHSQLISQDDERYLVEAAAMLSMSEIDKNKKTALTITTILPKYSMSYGVLSSCLLILNRLTNFPSIPLVLDKSNIESEKLDYKEHLNYFSSIEALVNETLFTVDFMEQPTILTRFQKKVMNLVTYSLASSISAPTSAGKSYVLIRYLLDILYKNQGSTVIYIVPTRALIRQVMDDIFKIASQSNIKNINISCSSDIQNVIDKPNLSNVLVLTQERLYQLCATNDAQKLKVKILIVDEAQEIQHGDRGVLLEEAIKFTLKVWSETKILFASPLVSNPEILLETFGYDKENADFDESTVVRQNLIKAVKIKNNILLKEVVDGVEKPLGSVGFTSTGKGASRARVLCDYVTNLWNEQTSIVYASEPIESAKTARFLFESEKFKPEKIDELNEFADFIEEHIHPRYELSNFIRSGIAFHFSKLPANVKSGVEDLMKAGLIKIVCCTPTLLEGLNLPAKNVFIYKPTRGDSPLKGIDFWNLAGRAGRMGKDLSGNIICIEPDSWDENPIDSPRTQKIQPALEKRLKEESDKVSNFVKDRDQGSGRDNYNEQIVSLVVRNRLELGETLVNSKYMTDENMKFLADIDYTVNEIISDYIAPVEILKQNPGILPDRINSLWRHFKKVPNWNTLMPYFPFESGSYKRLNYIFTLINEHILLGRYTEAQIGRLTVIGHKWMAGNPLSELIAYGLQPDEKPSKITTHVKKLMDTLETEIRFTFVKYTQLYTQLLKCHLEELGKQESDVKIYPISSFLEYGACSMPPLTFMSIGLSRAASISLSREFGNRPDVTREDCVSWLARLDVDRTRLAAFLKREVINVQKGIK